MAKLTAATRAKIPTEKFALPGKRAYPIQDASHARVALGRARQFASPSEQATIRAKVSARYPSIKVSGKKMRGLD